MKNFRIFGVSSRMCRKMGRNKEVLKSECWKDGEDVSVKCADKWGDVRDERKIVKIYTCSDGQKVV